ncbi:Muskelin 1, intracellular mediator containing kelch motif [Apophysomyces ossiformis]|uniref:Muskelin 1, intracellular mediator containing kelch motif n=1 Tax=Apophysomyces ossiformis TaxID=679940 RepID=A0A8H7BTK6_9FUNG|nr:Muskelin 1, intracellular mediator containing kelch motif [Apophysomyces ossiformis]
MSNPSDVATMVANAPHVKLSFSIYDYSSHSGAYHPQNIYYDKPTEQSSRWSSGTHDHNQFIILRLDKPVVARHVCNLKEFKIYGGMEPDDTIEILHQVQFIKIVPLSTYGANFNYSIWYVELNGIEEEAVVQTVIKKYNNYKEEETIRLCLKHFRQLNMTDVFHLLKQRSSVRLEHPLLTQLHHALVVAGDFATAESIIQEAAACDLFKAYADNAEYSAVWRKIHATTAGRYVESHTMTEASLESDFYRYFVDTDEWLKISHNTAREGGPELLFDHQMCVDPKKQMLYVFGGRVVSNSTSIHNYSGLFSYHIQDNIWTLVRNDVSVPTCSAQSSPQTPNRSETSTPVQQNGSRVNGNSLSPCSRLKSRVGHSMIFDPATRDLYIFASQRSKDNMSNLYRYSVDTEMVTELSEDFSRNSASDPGYTQRVTMDVQEQELYIYSGYMRSKACNVVKHSLWVYNLRKDRWDRVYQNESRDAQYQCRMRHVEPCPRFAHQMVYDPNTRAQFIFGGNPGDFTDPSRRLSDFWELRLIKPDTNSIVRRCLYLIRIQQLRELCIKAVEKGKLTVDGRLSSYTTSALDYLQQKVTPLVNHTQEEEVRELHELCAHLVVSDESSLDFLSNDGQEGSTQFERRTRLFGNLMVYFPRDMKEPEGTLVNVVKLE